MRLSEMRSSSSSARPVTFSSIASILLLESCVRHLLLSATLYLVNYFCAGVLCLLSQGGPRGTGLRVEGLDCCGGVLGAGLWVFFLGSGCGVKSQGLRLVWRVFE